MTRSLITTYMMSRELQDLTGYPHPVPVALEYTDAETITLYGPWPRKIVFNRQCLELSLDGFSRVVLQSFIRGQDPHEGRSAKYRLRAQRHRKLHRALDELLACYLQCTACEKLPSETTLLELIEWSWRMMHEPACANREGKHGNGL